MKRALIYALSAAVLAGGNCVAQLKVFNIRRSKPTRGKDTPRFWNCSKCRKATHVAAVRRRMSTDRRRPP